MSRILARLGCGGGSRHPVAGMAVNCSRRWHPLFHEAHKMMKAGDLGEMLQVTGYGTCPLSSNGSHLIDTMCFLADSKVDWLFGELNETDAATPDADLQGNAYLAFANGLRGYMRGMNCGAASWDFEAIGTEGRIRSSTHGLDFELHRLVPGGIRGASLPVKYPYPWPVSIEGMGEIIISDLIHCIETGDSPRCSGDDARHALEVAFGVHASHRAGGQRIDLPLDERNQPTLHAEVRAAIEEADRGTFTPEVQDHGETVKRNGGRRERRTSTVLGGPGLCEWVADPAAWPGLRSLIRVRTERNGSCSRQRSMRYYISSLPVDAEALLERVRGHWRVPSGRGNGLHRTLDVEFREDDCRLRRGHAVMGIPGRAALNIVRTLQQNFRPDLSMGLLRDKIGRNPALLAPILV